MKRNPMDLGRKVLFAAAALTVIVCWISVDLAGAQEISRKMKREVRIMEEIISDVLVESPNWLVDSGAPNYGIYVDGFGLMFNFRTSLVSRSYYSGRHGIRILGDIFSWYDDDDDWDDEDDDGEDIEDEEAYKRWRKNRRARSGTRYERGKAELREVLAHSGDILTELEPNDWIAMGVFLRDHSYFRRNKISRLLLKVRASDAQAFENKSITLEELESRIVEEEY